MPQVGPSLQRAASADPLHRQYDGLADVDPRPAPHPLLLLRGHLDAAPWVAQWDPKP